MGKVYLVGIPEEERYKIGWTRGPIDKRIVPLQTGNPKKIEVIHLFETDHYMNIETRMHHFYGAKRMEGEWFELTNEDVNKFLSECKKSHDIFEMLSDNPFL